MTDMLTGVRSPATPAERWLPAILILLMAFPLLLMSGLMILVGVLALGPRQDGADLWICLPAGLALLGVLAAVVYCVAIRYPALTISRFSLGQDELEWETPMHGSVTSRIEGVHSITDVRNRRSAPGRKLKGWWLQLDRAGWVYLQRDMPNAELLVNQLRRELSGRHADMGSAADR